MYTEFGNARPGLSTGLRKCYCSGPHVRSGIYAAAYTRKKERYIMKKKGLAALLCLSMTASLVVGCGSTTSGMSAESTADTASSAAEGATAASTASSETSASSDSGKTFTFAISSECQQLDPALNSYLSSSSMILNLFMGLEMTGEDGKSIVPGCAESYEVSDDQLTYTFHLYDDLKWSDGTPLTAHDFEWSWKRELNPDTASPCCDYLFPIAGAEEYNAGTGSEEDVGIHATDDTTLVVTLKNPTPYFINLTTVAAYMPVQQKAVESSDTWTLSPDTFVCNGAFMMTGYSPEESYTLTKNPNYKYADAVQVDTVNVDFISDDTTALTAFENGEIDMTNNIAVSAQQKYSGTDTLQNYSTIGTSYLDVNCETVNDPRVRLALNEAIDRSTVVKLIGSNPEPATGFVPEGISYYDSDKSFRDTVGDLITYDPEGAKSLLDEAVADGFDASRTFTYICQNNAEQTNIAQAIQSMWQQNLGINVEIKTYESGSYWDVVHSGDFDFANDGWTGDYDDPSTMLNVFVQGNVETNCRWADDAAIKYDKMQDEAAAETDQAKRYETFSESEKLLLKDCPLIPIYYRRSQMLVGSRIAYTTNDTLGHYLIKYVKLN